MALCGRVRDPEERFAEASYRDTSTTIGSQPRTVARAYKTSSGAGEEALPRASPEEQESKTSDIEVCTLLDLGFVQL